FSVFLWLAYAVTYVLFLASGGLWLSLVCPTTTQAALWMSILLFATYLCPFNAPWSVSWYLSLRFLNPEEYLVSLGSALFSALIYGALSFAIWKMTLKRLQREYGK